MSELVVDFAWLVSGPFVTAGAEATHTVDMRFHRDAAGRLSVGKSHVKGKVLEAALAACDAGVAREEWVRWWFGKADLDVPRGERVFFSDLRPVPADPGGDSWVRSELGGRGPGGGLDPGSVRAWPSDFSELAPGAPSLIVRTALDDKRTAAEHTLRVAETQPRGLELLWAGRVEAEHCAEEQLRALAAFLLLCHARVENLGASTTAGYGRILTPTTGPAFRASIDGTPVDRADLVADCAAARADGRWMDPPAPGVPAQAPAPEVPGPASRSRAFGLVLAPREPVYVLERKRPDAHFATGPGHISGAVVKGAVAGALNRLAGLPLTAAIDAGHPAAARFPHLCREFTGLRFLHALPLPGPWTEGQGRRPLPAPLSAFSGGKTADRVWDAALDWDDAAPAPGVARAWFAPDCEELTGYLSEAGSAGAALDAVTCQKGVEVRVAIQEASRAAAVGQLFGYEFIADVAARNAGGGAPEVYGPVFATGVVVADDDAGLADRLWTELADVLPLARIGKTNAAVRWARWEPAAAPLEERLAAYGDEPLVLTLVTDALLPLDTDAMQSMTDMTALYDAAWGREWDALCRDAGVEPSTATRPPVRSVFARQSLRGGWVGRRGREGAYQAFCLTLAGTVLVTGAPASAVRRDQSLLAVLRRAEERGLPLAGDGLTWRTCPFVPENGFGEVLVCPEWHLLRRPVRTAEGA